MTETLWNMSTTVRNPERLPQFLEVAAELEGQEWNKDNQKKFQILLIQHRKYLNEDNTQTFNKLSSDQISLLKNKNIDMSYQQAADIFAKKDYKDPPMRGRQSMNPLVKLGMIHIDEQKIIHLTDVGMKLYKKEISWGDFVLDSMLKYQLPNEITEGYATWNIKPFIGILHLIKEVNLLCVQRGLKAKGISTEEFAIFALSLKSYEDIHNVAEQLLAFRQELDKIKPSDYHNAREYQKACTAYTNKFIKDYLADFTNPVHNVHEYGDSMKRYLRQTKYIFLRGKYANQYIDLEPRRMIEIDSILSHDSAKPVVYTKEGWLNFMGTYGAYPLPFETVPYLSKIFTNIVKDINALEDKLGKIRTNYTPPQNIQKLKEQITSLRNYRIELLNLEIKYDYAHDISKIDNAVRMLTDLSNNRKNDDMVNKPSVELEKWVNIALNIINDAVSIKPNSPVGDDNEPTFTAPANVPDIECDYGSFGSICEVTMLRGRDQWFNEGQPVMRHLRDYENSHDGIPAYCLFVAPSLHEDTLETYWTATKIAYKGKKQNIIPITIKQLASMLVLVKKLKGCGSCIKRENLKLLYDSCVDLNKVDSSETWPSLIQVAIDSWQNTLLNNTGCF